MRGIQKRKLLIFIHNLLIIYGIVIYVYYRDHIPSHFHAIYGQYEAKIGIDTVSILEGKLPGRAKSLVLEWAKTYKKELKRDWELARVHESLQPIPPLD
jgi:hypothetical protein